MREGEMYRDREHGRDPREQYTGKGAVHRVGREQCTGGGSMGETPGSSAQWGNSAQGRSEQSIGGRRSAQRRGSTGAVHRGAWEQCTWGWSVQRGKAENNSPVTNSGHGGHLDFALSHLEEIK